MHSELSAGQKALYRSVEVDIVELVGHDRALITVGEDQRLRSVLKSELVPILNAKAMLDDTDVMDIPGPVWEKASRRATMLRQILELPSGRTEALQSAANVLGMSARQLWRDLDRFHEEKTVTSLFCDASGQPIRAGRKTGARVLDIEVERIISEKILEDYLVPERPTVAHLVEIIGVGCRAKKLKPPSRKAVERRLEAYETIDAQRRRVGRKKAKYTYQAMPGHVEVGAPLERVEIDHTPMDVMACSDDPLSSYVGRPWLTVAIDVYSRCILGIHIGFEPPSILSVALCLTHAVLPKGSAETYGVPLEWLMYGKPKEIVVDNGKDFVSEAFRRGCEEHGIKLSFRPIGCPHYGGTIERLIGTMVGRCHLLPGTTKNSVKAKGDYDSKKHATLTLRNVRRWFVEQVLGYYHVRTHRMLRIPPQVAWRGLEGGAHV